jgi:transposase
MQLTTIGLDLAKQVFQVHGVDATGVAVIRRRLRRSEVIRFFAKIEPCLVGMEACATAHFWARELSVLGHTVKLIPPAYVKAYVKRGKTDAADAEAICEAVSRPSMRFVPIKSTDQQAILMLHRARDLLVRQRTMLANAIRGHLRSAGSSRRKALAESETSPLCCRRKRHVADGGAANPPYVDRPAPGINETDHGARRQDCRPPPAR